MPLTHFVSLPFLDSEDGPVSGEPNECHSPNGAVSSALTLSRKEGNVGAVAFSHTGDPALGDFADAVVIKTFGEVPQEFANAC